MTDRRAGPGPVWIALTLAVGLAAICSSPLSAAIDSGRTRLFRYLMGTSMRIEVFGSDAATRQQAADEAFAAIGEVDRLMSDYRDDSELTLVNRTASAGPVPVSAPLFAVLDAAEQVSRQSGGAFDVTLRPLAELWGVRTRQPHVPTPSELASVRPLIGYRSLTLDRQSRTVRFARYGMAIDLGGVATGFAAEIAAGSLTRRSLAGVIDTGGTQYMVGLPAGKQSWSVGIGHPDRANVLLGAIDVGQGAVSTASDSSALLPDAAGTNGRPLDPRTLQPSIASLSATVVSADGTLAGALARAAFVLGPTKGLALLDGFAHTWGIVAWRQPNGTVGISVSAGHLHSFHPASTR